MPISCGVSTSSLEVHSASSQLVLICSFYYLARFHHSFVVPHLHSLGYSSTMEVCRPRSIRAATRGVDNIKSPNAIPISHMFILHHGLRSFLEAYILMKNSKIDSLLLLHPHIQKCISLLIHVTKPILPQLYTFLHIIGFGCQL